MRLDRPFLAFACAVVCIWAVPAAAQDGAVVVRSFEGRGAARVRAAVVKALQKRGVDLLPSSEADEAARAFGADVETDQGRAVVSLELGIAAWIEGDIERDGKLRIANIEVFEGETGSSLGLMSVDGRNPRRLAKKVERMLWGEIGEMISSARAPEPSDAPEADEVDEGFDDRRPRKRRRDDSSDDEPQDEPESGSGSGLTALELQLGMVGFSRSFEYNEDLSGLRTYSLGAGPAVGGRVRWYPLAHGGGDGVLENIGLELAGQRAFAIDSALAGTTFETTEYRFLGALKVRLPLGDHELGASFGYTRQVFRIKSGRNESGAVAPGIPSTDTRALRLGADARLALGQKWEIAASGAWLPVLSVGAVEDWFPQASATGFDMELMLAHRLSDMVDLRAAFQMRRFAYELAPTLQDAGVGRPIAGGAVDDAIGGYLAAGFRLDG